MRIYVASAFEDYQRARSVMARLRDLGHVITHDWTGECESHPGDAASSLERQTFAVLDVAGVLEADAVVVLTGDDKSKGCGMWCEMGMAIASGIPVFTAGQQNNRSVFCELTERFETDEEMLDCFKGFA